MKPLRRRTSPVTSPVTPAHAGIHDFAAAPPQTRATRTTCGRVILVAIAIALSLTACGRRGAPTPPGPAADVTYPHEYPSN